ncbi:VOC family protein [Aureliella helgolandensis]|uniref:Glyoxalase-like domain protein n=1 Tax=Aureliella helgolandensis TaxID=2527968 RepID=A0A518G691_9BACT|nr:VOC family protein [Aureliella helgolandensis]QDV24089.1 Glyoxalase-like domain protein [Aureliella helgolandensis]
MLHACVGKAGELLEEFSRPPSHHGTRDEVVAEMSPSTNQIVLLSMQSPPTCEFVPYLSATDAAKAVAFYSRVFSVEPHALLNMPDGRVMHCEFRIGNARFFVSEDLPEHGGAPSPTRLGGTTVAIHLYVDDCDAMVKTMSDNGATILMPPADMFWGERFARIRDPFGHEWGIATQLQEMTADEIKAVAAKMFEEMTE